MAFNMNQLIITERCTIFGLKKILARRRKDGLGALVSSHMLDFVERIADNMIILKKGIPVFTGKVEEAFRRYPDKKLDEIYYHLFVIYIITTFLSIKLVINFI